MTGHLTSVLSSPQDLSPCPASQLTGLISTTAVLIFHSRHDGEVECNVALRGCSSVSESCCNGHFKVARTVTSDRYVTPE